MVHFHICPLVLLSLESTHQLTPPSIFSFFSVSILSLLSSLSLLSTLFILVYSSVTYLLSLFPISNLFLLLSINLSLHLSPSPPPALCSFFSALYLSLSLSVSLSLRGKSWIYQIVFPYYSNEIISELLSARYLHIYLFIHCFLQILCSKIFPNCQLWMNNNIQHDEREQSDKMILLWTSLYASNTENENGVGDIDMYCTHT